MRVRQGALTPQEHVFVQHYAPSGDAMYAAEKAGYVNPHDAAAKLPVKPRVAEAAEKIREKLRTTGAEIGVQTLIDLCDPKVPPGVRRAAASDLVKYSGVSGLEEGKRLELYDMTYEQLTRRREEILAQRAELAKVIEHEPDPGPIAQPAPNDTVATSLFS